MLFFFVLGMNEVRLSLYLSPFPCIRLFSFFCQEMSKAGCKLPLLIGGATTSKMHTAVKISPQYASADVSDEPSRHASPLLNDDLALILGMELLLSGTVYGVAMDTCVGHRILLASIAKI